MDNGAGGDEVDWELMAELSEVLGHDKHNPYKHNEYVREAIEHLKYYFGIKE